MVTAMVTNRMIRDVLIVCLLMGWGWMPAARAGSCLTVLERNDLFPPQQRHVHSSTLVESPAGGLLAAWFHGSGERTAADVELQAAWRPAGAVAWGPVFPLVDTPGFPDCNPVLYRDGTDRLWLFWIVVRAARWEESLTMYQRSVDWPEGAEPRWERQGVVLLKPGEEFASVLEAGLKALAPTEGLWSSYARKYTQLVVEAAKDPAKRQIGWMTRTPPISDGVGGFLLPLYSDGFNISLVAWSRDDGRSWECSEPITGLGNVQPSLVRRRDGEVLAYMRDNGNPPQRVMVSSSGDGGRTWSPALDDELPNPGSSLQVIVLRQGPWVMVLNDTEDGRHRLTAYLSSDEGRSWALGAVLEEAEPGRGSYSYPTVIQSADGLMHVTYSCRDEAGGRIRHAVVRLDQESAGGVLNTD